MRLLLTGLLISCTTLSLQAQRLLNSPMSITVRQQPLSAVLQTIAARGGFSFSYNAAILPEDSLVSLSVQQQPLRQVLDRLFAGRFDYLEDGRYLILRPATHKLYSGLPPMQVRDLEPVTIWEKKLLARKGRKASFHPLGGESYGSSNMAISGLFNIHRGSGRNLQLAGVVNINEGVFKGVQAASVHNTVSDTLKGVQVSALLNEGKSVVKGVQLGAVNHAGKLKGWQVGFVNMADSSSGYSLGVINLVRDGYHHVTLATSDLMNTNVTVKLGNAHLYSILSAGGNISAHQKLYALGFGLGHDFILGERVSFGVQAHYQFLKRFTWDNRLMQAKGLLNIRPGKHLVFFGGPVWNHYTEADGPRNGYKDIVTQQAYADADARYSKASRNWVGWELGIAAPSILFITPAAHLQSRKGWRLGLGPTVGVSLRGDWSIGAEAYLQKGWETNISLMLVTAWMQYTALTYVTGPYNGVYSEKAYSRFVPLMAGLKILTGRYFYVGAGAGPGFSLQRTPTLRFTGGPFFGWEAGHWDLGGRIQYISKEEWQPVIRLMYTGRII